MRQLLVEVPRGRGRDVAEIASAIGAITTTAVQGEREGEPVDVILANVSNRRVEKFLEEVEELPDAHISFYPMGVLALRPPPSEAADQVTDVEMLSPIEVFLAGRQSVGSWGAFLGYAASAGAVVWVGLYIGSVYLLIAAMLVAPFAGPAMNSAIATASGQTRLLWRTLVRYFAALFVTSAAACVLTLLIGPDSPSPRMAQEAQVSGVAVILPLVAGAAGALYLLTSERSSLVSGAAVGLLVAASLAPPAGVVGMAVALGRWDMAANASFVLALQLVGIHLSGSVLFRIFGLYHKGTRREPTGRLLFPLGLTGTAIVLAILLTIQFSDPVTLNRTTLAQTIGTEIRRVASTGEYRLEHVSTEFTNTPAGQPPVLLAEVFVRHPGLGRVALDSTARILEARIHRHLAQRRPDITPVLEIRWVSAPQ